MNRSLNLIARAKINLSLAVTGKRDDGYHTISSIMQQISLRDTLRIRITDGEGVSLQSNVPYLPTDSRNLCVKAALLYLEAGKLQKKINIHVNKRIPVAAGLAGGSTDAAAVLLGSPLAAMLFNRIDALLLQPSKCRGYIVSAKNLFKK